MDTHTLIWLILDDPRLSQKANEAVNEAVFGSDCELLVSIISLWEIAIKTNNGKLDIKMSLEQFLAKQQMQYRIKILPLATEHLFVASTLLFPHVNHKDSFDRILISQCLVEKIPIISIDAKIDAYGVQRIW